MSLTDPILTISIAANLLGLHPRTLMIYEASGLLTPHRTKTNRRLFSITDLNDLQFVKYLTQGKGINIQGVKLILQAIEIGKKEGIDLKKQLFPEFRPQPLL